MPFRSRVGIIAALTAARLSAQSPDSIGTVSGTVFDSVTMRPAAGAVVQLVSRAAPADRPIVATANAHGRYEVRALAGSYLIGFQHPTLDSLNISAPIRLVEARGGASVRADLAVPSPARIVSDICRANPRDSTGAVIGVLRDARTGIPVRSGRVFATWNDLVIAVGEMRFVEQKKDAPVNDDGTFVLCGVAMAGGDAFLVATDGVDTTGAILKQFPAHGLMRQDFSVGGHARVDIKVSSERGPVANAATTLAGSMYPGWTDSTGVFRFPGAHAGTQTLEVRALGYMPERIPVSIVAGRDTAISVRLTTFKAVMDTIRVVAQRVYWSDARGFESRRKRGLGKFFGEQEIARRRPRDVLDLLRGIPGLRVDRSAFGTRVVSTRGSGTCGPSLFIDGMMLAPDLVRDLDMLVRIEEVMGVEVYVGGSGTPAQFASFGGCGAIVVWTRAPLPRRDNK